MHRATVVIATMMRVSAINPPAKLVHYIHSMGIGSKNFAICPIAFFLKDANGGQIPDPKKFDCVPVQGVISK